MTQVSSEEKLPYTDEPLPFSKPKQEALLGHLLLNDKFFGQASTKIKPHWFVDPRCSQVYKALVVESGLIHRKVKPDELKESYSFINAGSKEAEILRSAVNRCITQTANFGLDSLTPELTDWLRARVYMEEVYKSRDLFNGSRNAADNGAARQRRAEAYRILREMGRTIDDIEFDGNEEVTFDNIQDELASYEAEYKNALTFGSRLVDSLLLPEADGAGSLLPGDMTVILGPQNAGKTSNMITTLAANLKQGKNAILIPHEGRKNDLKLKLIQCMLGLTKRELFYYGRDPGQREKFQLLEEYLRDHLVYIPMIKAGLTVEEVGNTVRRAIDRFMAKHNGAPIHLLVDDYLARCATVQNGKGQLQKREKDQYVYEYGASLAGECNLHLLTGIQVNRQGNEINRHIKKGVEERLLVPEDVSESYGTMMVATNIISINRSPQAQARNRVTFLICKSRSSEVHLAIACGSNYACCQTHGDHLGATWYRGLSAMEERIDELMQQYNNSNVPDKLVLSAG